MSMSPVDPCAAEFSGAEHVPSQISHETAMALQQIGRQVSPPMTEALYAPLSECEPYAGIELQRDLPYGPHARNLLDIFLPQGRCERRPVLVFVHGGAFMRGDRRIGSSPFNDNIALWAVRQGMLGVNMTYRLAPGSIWPAAQVDIRSAITWLRANIGARGGDPQRIFLMGHSAGAAHVAQYLAFPQFHAVPGSGVAGAVMFSGIYDPATAQVNPPLQAYFGVDASVYRARSAVKGLVASGVPQLLAYAELDPPDFCRQAEQLHTAFRQAGRRQALYRFAGHSHMSEIYSINTPDTAVAALLEAFLDACR
jgi:acetyl esterase/lipase